jgi:hypothetical protein
MKNRMSEDTRETTSQQYELDNKQDFKIIEVAGFTKSKQCRKSDGKQIEDQ